MEAPMATPEQRRKNETRQERDGAIRSGGPIAVPEGPLCRWYLDRTEKYSDLPVARVKGAAPSAPEGSSRDGEFVPITYARLLEDAREVAGGLLELAEPGDRIAIIAETRYEWIVVDMATVLARFILVPVYPSFSDEQMVFVIENAGATVAVTETDLPEEAEAVVNHVVDIEALPRGEFNLDAAPGLEADDEDVHTIIHTSGTTGMPKGCEITHRNLLAQIEMWVAALPDQPPGSIATVFLPLNHLQQRFANYVAIDQGISSAYMSVDTLLDDFLAVRPDTVGGVPRVYRRIFDGLREKVAEEEGAKRRLAEAAIDIAIEYGKALERGNLPPVLRAKHAAADRLVLSTFRERLGLDEVAFAGTGAASIDSEVLYFFWGMGVPLLDAYGATEMGAVTFNRIDDFHAGTVGTPVPGIEIKLGPGNEVLVRGPSVMTGYWNNPAATAKAIDENDWYHTGDVGEWHDDHLTIVDRMKRLQVLDTGENVYPTPIEDKLTRSQYVAEAMVIAEDRKFLSALVQPTFDAVLAVAENKGIDYDESAVEYEGDEVVAVPRALVEHEAVRSLVQAAITEANTQLADYERVKKFELIPRALSVEEDELTPTLKKRRRDIKANWADEIESMYGGE